MKAFVIDGSEHSVQDVISRLKFISTIKPEEKIDVSTLSIQNIGILGRLYRTFFARSESRQATLDFIRYTLGDAFELAAVYLRDQEPRERTMYDPSPHTFNMKISEILINSLIAAKTGIESLKETYRDDRMFVSRVGTLIDTLDAKIIDFSKISDCV